MGGDQTIGVQRVVIFGIAHQKRSVVFEYAPHDGAADGNLLTGAEEAIESADVKLPRREMAAGIA